MNNDDKLEQNNDIKTVFFNVFVLKNGIYTIFNIIITVVGALLFSIIITRTFPKSTYGMYEFILAFFTFGIIFSVPGLRTVSFKAFSQGKDGIYKKSNIISLKISLIASGILVIIGLFFSFNLTNIDTGISFIIAALFCPFYFGLLYWETLLKGKEKFRLYFILKSLHFLMRVTLVLIFFWFYEVISVILLIFIDLGTVSISNLIFTLYCSKFIKNNKQLNNWKRHGFELSIMDMSQLIYRNVGSIIIGILLPFEFLAIFALTLNIGNLILHSIKNVIEVLHPRIYNTEINGYFYKIIIIFLISFILPFIGGFLIPYPILLLYTEKYVEIVPYVQLILYCIPLTILSGFLGPYLIKNNLNKQINISKIVTIITTIALNFIIIPPFGILGGIICFFLYYLIQCITMYVFGYIHYRKSDIIDNKRIIKNI